MTPKDFASRTREQWVEFEEYKMFAFQETDEEKNVRELTEKQEILLEVKHKLASVWIEVKKIPSDFAPMYKKYIESNEKMKERLWEDLQAKIDYYSTNHNTLREFASFVLAY